MSDETRNVRMKAMRSFSGNQTGANYLGRVEIDEQFEVTEADASYLVRNGFAQRASTLAEAPKVEDDAKLAAIVDAPAGDPFNDPDMAPIDNPAPQSISDAGGIEPDET